MNDHHFGFGHFLHGVSGAFLAHAAVLESSVWHGLGTPRGAEVDV